MIITFNSRPRWLRLMHKYEQWHTWFAWRPVFMTLDEVVWLERVDRSRTASDWRYAPLGTHTGRAKRP